MEETAMSLFQKKRKKRTSGRKNGTMFRRKLDHQNRYNDILSDNRIEEPASIKVKDWFRHITGSHERTWRKKNRKKMIIVDSKGINESTFIIKNPKSNICYHAGCFSKLCLDELMTNAWDANTEPGGEYIPIEIIMRKDHCWESMQQVDVANLQALSSNQHALFQVASNFNSIEAVNEESYPDEADFTECYFYDKTQGPAASISAGAAAIMRVHGMFYSKDIPINQWAQTETHQINFLEHPELRSFFPVQNGYVILPLEDEKSFPEEDSPEWERLLRTAYIGYHRNVEVTTGGSVSEEQSERIRIVKDQHIDQVFCAAINLSQGFSGRECNANASSVKSKARFVLDIAYQGTYLSAIKHGKKHIFLTLIGGGVFGNPKSWIYNAIVKAHSRWATAHSGIDKVTLILFSPLDLKKKMRLRLFKKLREQKIPFHYKVVKNGKLKLLEQGKTKKKDPQ